MCVILFYEPASYINWPYKELIKTYLYRKFQLDYYSFADFSLIFTASFRLLLAWAEHFSYNCIIFAIEKFAL